MLDLNIPTKNPVTTTLAPQDDVLATEMSNSLQFDFISNSLEHDATAVAMATTTSSTALNWNLSHPLQATVAAGQSSAANVSGSAAPMVNVATNFIYDWCNQSSSYPAVSTGNAIGSNSGGNCSSYTTALDSWNNSTNDTSV